MWSRGRRGVLLGLAGSVLMFAGPGPLRAQTQFSELMVIKIADRPVAEIGDIVNYRVIIENASPDAITGLVVNDRPPAWFTLVPGTAHVEEPRRPLESIGSDTHLSFPIGQLGPGETITMLYRLRVGANAGEGRHENLAQAIGTLENGVTVASAQAQASVDVVPGPFTMSQALLGRVFEDIDGNGYFNGKDRPVAGARIYLSDGQAAITDVQGLYNVPSVGIGAIVASLDPLSLPQGFVLIDEEHRSGRSWTRLLRTPLGQGGLLRQNFPLQRSPTQAQQAATLDLPATATDPAAAVATDQIHRIEIIIDKKEIAAGARESTVIRVKAFDAADQPVRRGSVLVDASYGRLVGAQACELDSESGHCAAVGLVAGQNVAPALQSPSNGLSLVSPGLEPTHGFSTQQINTNFRQHQVPITDGEGIIHLLSEVQVGRSVISVFAGPGVQAESEVLFVTGKRPPILVSLAQFSLGKASPESAILTNDDTVRGYAKFFVQSPLLNSQNMLTMAYDSSRRLNHTAGRDRLFQLDSLDRLYPLFGDSSTQFEAAQSNSNLFVRVDRGLSYVMFGDLRPNLNATSRTGTGFTSYQRNLTGIEVHLEDKTGSVLNAKGARPDTAFARDILPGYAFPLAHLSHQNILAGTEMVIFETRDRRNPELVISRDLLVRNVDYNIDWLLGTIYFLREPRALDRLLNLTQIVLTYEFETDGISSSAYDVRGEKVFSGIGLKLGGSFVENHQHDFGNYFLEGIHGEKKLHRNGTLRIEAARSHGRFLGTQGTYDYVNPLLTGTSGPSDEHDGFAYRAELEQPFSGGTVLNLAAFKTQQDFINPYGMTTVPGARQEWGFLELTPTSASRLRFGYRNERNKTTNVDNRRQTASVLLRQELSEKVRLTAGYDFRDLQDNGAANDVSSNLLTGQLDVQFTSKLLAAVRREQNLSDADPTYPNQTVLHGTYQFSDFTRFFFTQRLGNAPIMPISDFNETGLAALDSRRETSVGFETRWRRYTSLATRYEVTNGINGVDSFAVIGLAHRLPLKKTFTLDTGYEHGIHLSGEGATFDSASVGFSWLPFKNLRTSSRYELRDHIGHGGILTTGIAGKLNDAATALARFQWARDGFQGNSAVSFNGTLAFALRPLKSDRVGLLFSAITRNFDQRTLTLGPVTAYGIGRMPFQGGTFLHADPSQFGVLDDRTNNLSIDGYWQIAKKLEFFGRFAANQKRVSGAPGEPRYQTTSVLVQNRFQYRFAKYFDAAAEGRWMFQRTNSKTQQAYGGELGFWPIPDLRTALGYGGRANVETGLNSSGLGNENGFYFSLTSKLSRLFDLFGTPSEGLQ